MLPMSVDTIASFGIARSSSRSIWRGCMCAEPFATSSDHASFSCVQPSSSLSHAAFSACDRRERARRGSRATGERLALRAASTSARGRGLRIAADADRDRLHQAEHLRVGVDLDDLRVLRPVVEAVLRQRAERSEARAEREHDVGLRDELHRRLAALVAERSAPQRMARRERIVVQIARGDRRLQQLGERDALRTAVRHDDAAAGEDHRELRRGEQRRRLVEAALAAGAALDRERPRNLALDVAVEEVARDVELRRAHLEHRAVERAAGELGHARPVVHVRLVLGDLREDRQLLGLLEAAEAERHAAGLRRDRRRPASAPSTRRRSTVTKLVMPGPFCAMHTPCRPETRE